jgi:hypothetical protein
MAFGNKKRKRSVPGNDGKAAVAAWYGRCCEGNCEDRKTSADVGSKDIDALAPGKKDHPEEGHGSDED